MKRDRPGGHHGENTVCDSNAEVAPLKGIEVALVSELIRNSRRSDRELARAIGVSQPTVSRIIERLEEEGVVNEYTMIPDFRKLGYNLCAFIFVKLKDLPPEGIERVRAAGKKEFEPESLCNSLT